MFEIITDPKEGGVGVASQNCNADCFGFGVNPLLGNGKSSDVQHVYHMYCMCKHG